MSDNSFLPSPTAWLQYYQENNPDAPAALAHSGGSGGGGGDLMTPRGTIAKQTRRRSRASKKTPTTLLNVSTTNFRALVQKYTGCQSAGVHRGPVNLNFSLANEQPESSPYKIHGQKIQNQLNQEEYQWFHQQQQQLQQHQDQQQYHNRTGTSAGNKDDDDDHDHGFPSMFSSNNSPNNNPSSNNMLTLEDYAVENIMDFPILNF